MEAGETVRIRARTKARGEFPVYADIKRTALGEYTVTIDNEDRPGVFLSRARVAHDKPHWEVSVSGARVFQADSEQRARIIAGNVVREQLGLFERLYDETPDAEKSTGWEITGGPSGAMSWEMPPDLRDRMKDAGPSQALAEEFGLDYKVVLMDFDFAGIPLDRCSGIPLDPQTEMPLDRSSMVLDPVDEVDMAGIDTTPIAFYVVPPAGGRAMVIVMLSHREEEEVATIWELQSMAIQQTVTDNVSNYEGKAFAVRLATPEEIES